MFKRLKELTVKNSVYRETLYMILFGAVSFGFGAIKIFNPELEQASMDLREIPLILSLIYISRPHFVIGMSSISLLNVVFEDSYFPLFITHAISLFVFWYIIQAILSLNKSGKVKAIISFFAVAGLYYNLIMVLFVITYQAFGINDNIAFDAFYLGLLHSIQLEIFATSLIVGVYILQHEFQSKLKKSNRELKEKNIKLAEYAFMNAHNLRVPVANIKGIIDLVEMAKSSDEKLELIGLLKGQSNKLDEVLFEIKEMLERSDMD